MECKTRQRDIVRWVFESTARPRGPFAVLKARRAASCALFLGMVSLHACAIDRQLHGVMIDPPREIASVAFTLPSGLEFRTAPESGRPMVLFFGYTHCPDVCPTTLADWKRAKQKLGSDGERVRFVFVTVDPERDTPTVADKYAKQFDSTFTGVSGDSATIARLLKEFGAMGVREPSADPKSYSVSHSGSSFLVDAKGRLIAMYPIGMGWDALAADLETIL